MDKRQTLTRVEALHLFVDTRRLFVRGVSFLIEPVLMAEGKKSPLYEDVMRTGVPV